jgi:hypothetical protein
MPQRGTLWSVFVTKYYSGDQIKCNETGGACGTRGGEEGVYEVLMGKPKG